MTRPLLLDLFCGAGGAAMGYHRAGFDVVGVDIAPQPHYPFEFVQCDALGLLDLADHDDFDAIHASPPCQDHSAMRTLTKRDNGTGWMLAETIRLLTAIDRPWVVENVAGSESQMPGSWFTLCGSMFGLQVRRHRRFVSSHMILVPSCDHDNQGVVHGVYGHGQSSSGRLHRWVKGLPAATVADWREAMGIEWMTRDELAQAIPPAYTEFIGAQLVAHIAERAA